MTLRPTESRGCCCLGDRRAVGEMMERHEADAITIECLFLKHGEPCVSFAMNNGDLIPCGCENHLDGTLTLMLGRWLLERAGFLHNPDFDTSENRYFGAHCTCAWKLHGPEGLEQSLFSAAVLSSASPYAGAGCSMVSQ